MKKLLLAAMISFGAIEASAYSYIASSTYGNTTYTYGSVNGNSVNLSSSRYGNNTSTYGNIGRNSVNLSTSRYGNNTSTYGNIGRSSTNLIHIYMEIHQTHMEILEFKNFW